MMAGKLPRPSKPREQLRRRNAPEQWTILPAAGCSLLRPEVAGRSAVEAGGGSLGSSMAGAAGGVLAQAIEPDVVARYVSLRYAKPELAALSRMEAELGLTPAALARLRLTVEEPTPAGPPRSVRSPAR